MTKGSFQSSLNFKTLGLLFIFVPTISISSAESNDVLFEPPLLFNINHTEEINERPEELSMGLDQALLEIKMAEFNTNVFNYFETDEGLFIHRHKSEVAVGQKISFADLYNDELLTLIVKKVERVMPNPDIVTFSGTLLNLQNSSFTFSIQENKILGRVKYKGLVHYLGPNDGLNGELTISIFDITKIPNDENDFVQSESDIHQSKSDTLEKSSSSNGNVSVMFLYASDVSNASLKAANVISDFNTALGNSLVSSNNFLTPIDISMLNTTFLGLCKHDILDDMKFNDFPFTNLDAEVNSKKADIAFTITNGPSGPNICYPGYPGRVGGKAEILIPSDPFAHAADNYLAVGGDLTGIHEIGHILGGQHPQYPNPGIDKGYLPIDTVTTGKYNYQTVMGAYDFPTCQFDGTIDRYCERVSHFSNPSVNYLGFTTGTVSDNDMESALETTMPTVSNWRTDSVSPPSTPLNSNTTHDCFGFNDVSWSSSSNATNFQVFKDIYSTFNSSEIIYFGDDTNITVNVPSGETWYLKVKACNSAGCSAMSGTQTAIYSSTVPCN